MPKVQVHGATDAARIVAKFHEKREEAQMKLNRVIVAQQELEKEKAQIERDISRFNQDMEFYLVQLVIEFQKVNNMKWWNVSPS